MALGFLTGLRRGTILTLSVSDLDVEEKVIRVDGLRMKAGRSIEVAVRDGLLALLLDGVPTDPDARLIGRRGTSVKTAFNTVQKKTGDGSE